VRAVCAASLFFIDLVTLIIFYFVKSTNYEVVHYVVFSILLHSFRYFLRSDSGLRCHCKCNRLYRIMKIIKSINSLFMLILVAIFIMVLYG